MIIILAAEWKEQEYNSCIKELSVHESVYLDCDYSGCAFNYVLCAWHPDMDRYFSTGHTRMGGRARHQRCIAQQKTKNAHLSPRKESSYPCPKFPLLNGYQHFASLKKAFGEKNVLGGLCFIETALDQEGTIIQTSPRHDIVFGEWKGGISERTTILLRHLDKAGFAAILSKNIQRDMEKGLPVETDHLHGSLLALTSLEQGLYPVLGAVYGGLKVYETTLVP